MLSHPLLIYTRRPIIPEPTPKLLDQVRHILRVKHYAIRTEEAYTDWIKRFILLHGKRHPQEMNSPEIEAFLNHLAVNEHVAAATQNQTFSALLFLYQHVLHKTLSNRVDALRAKPSTRLPTVLNRSETQALLTALSGPPQLIARLLYGSGLRLIEGLRLRVKDIKVETTMIYTHVIKRGGLAALADSPLDGFGK